MRIRTYQHLAWMASAVLLLACGPAQSSTTQGGRSVDGTGSANPKRVVAAIMGGAFTFNYKVAHNAVTSPRGADALEQLVHSGLANMDRQGALRPQLAEDVPSVNNGMWRLFPDGRMETTWKLRSGALWQDGNPLTADDLLFTIRVAQDEQLPDFADRAFPLMESVEASDARTVTIRWRKPFIYADRVFTSELAIPLPKHLLERAYLEDKSGFMELPYWTSQFVGAGPFALKEWVVDSHLVVRAFDGYLLGRARIDEVEVKFVPDQNALMAHLLAGTVDFTLGQSLTVDQANTLREQWKDGRVDVAPYTWIQILPQLLDPTPALVANVQLRRALLHATDRQQLLDTFQAGMGAVAHSYLSSEEPEYREIEHMIVRYEYDPRRAGELIEQLGFTRTGDGSYVDQGNRPLSLELRTTADDLRGRILLAVTDYWQRTGVVVDSVVVPQQRARDLEYRASFPAFELTGRSNQMSDIGQLHSSQVPVAENRFTGGNGARYQNPQFDELIDRYLVTVPLGERAQLAGQIMNHMTDRVLSLSMFYRVEPTLVANRIKNVMAKHVRSTQSWNAHEWDVS